MTDEEKAEGIDFNAVLLDLNGKPMRTSEDEDEAEDVRLGNVCINALMATLREDKADGVEKLKRFNLAQKIKGTEDAFNAVRLNKKQKTMIESMADKAFNGSLMYARIYEALEGTTEDDDDE